MHLTAGDSTCTCTCTLGREDFLPLAECPRRRIVAPLPQMESDEIRDTVHNLHVCTQGSLDRIYGFIQAE